MCYCYVNAKILYTKTDVPFAGYIGFYLIVSLLHKVITQNSFALL